MAKFDYAEAAQDAKELIDEFGGAGSFSRVSGGGIDPVTGDSTPETTTTVTGTVTPVLSYRANEVNGESVLQGDGYVFFDGAAVLVDDYITINAEVWRAVNISKIESVDGVTVYQRVQLRR